MALTAARQPQAGLLIRAHRESMGLSRAEFCRRVERLKRGPDEHAVTLSESALWWIESKGVVPTTPRQGAIGRVIGVKPAHIWTTPASLLAAHLPERQAA